MALLEINRHPSRRDLAWFGIVLLLFFVVIGGVVGRALASHVARNVTWTAGAVLALVYYAVPAVRRPMFVGWRFANRMISALGMPSASPTAKPA